MTGSRKGAVTLWKDYEIEKWTKLFNKWTLVFYKDGRIFAASEYEDVVEHDMNLNVVKKFTGCNCQPSTIDANESYLAVGYHNNAGKVILHRRKDLDENGTHQKIMVSNFFY